DRTDPLARRRVGPDEKEDARILLLLHQLASREVTGPGDVRQLGVSVHAGGGAGGNKKDCSDCCSETDKLRGKLVPVHWDSQVMNSFIACFASSETDVSAHFLTSQASVSLARANNA